MSLHFLRRSSAALLLLALLRPSGAADRSNRASDSPPQRWTLKTLDTQLVLGVISETNLCFCEVRSPADWNWTPLPAPFPLASQAEVNGTRKPLVWHYQKAATDQREGERVILTFTNADPALELTSTWQARPGPGPVRHTLFIRNLSPGRITLFQQESLDILATAPDGPTRVCYINDDGSVPDAVGVYQDALTKNYRKTILFSEAQDFIPLVYVDAGGRHGLYVGWEWSIGRMTMSAQAAPGSVRLTVGSGDNFKTDLDPGEVFEAPPGFIGAYQGDLDDGANRLRKYLFNYSMPPILKRDPAYPKVEWNAFAATGKGQGSWDSTEAKYRPLIDAIAPMGFEEVVLDVGWWQGDTTHKPHPPVGDRLDWPSGMLAARDYAHKQGLHFGLYWNCNPAMTTREGIEHRVADARYLYDQFRIDFFRSDGTDGNVLQTGGHGSNTRAHYAEDAGYWQTKGYYEVLDTLYAAIPNFSYENCSGGGRIKDYGILKRCLKIQNQDRYYPLDARQSFYDSSFALHPMQIAALCGSWAEWQAAGSVFEFRSSSLGAAYWHPDAPNSGNGGPVWTTSQKLLIKEAVNTYKTMIRPLVRHANLYHIFPRPTGKIWDGLEYFDPASRKGAVFVFRPDSPAASQAVPFKGLSPRASYWLWCEDGSFAPVRMRGELLLQAGLTLRLPQPNTSEIIFFQDAALGKPKDLRAPGRFALQSVKTTSQLVSASAEFSWEPSRDARMYRVRVGPTPLLSEAVAQEISATPSVTLRKLPPGRTLYWKVEAIARGGTTASSGPSGQFETPEAQTRGITFASDLPWTKAQAGAETKVERDQNLRGQTLCINRMPFEKGLWTHSFNDNSPADIVFDISGRNFALFKATVGLDDLGEKGSVQFQVLVDGQKMAESPVMLPKQTHLMAVEVSGAKEVTLRVLNGGNGHAYDHAVWGWARFLKAGAKDPLEQGR